VIDTSSASGELIVNVSSSLAQFERRLIQERVRAGFEAARARGRRGGRKRLSPDDPRVKAAKKMSENRDRRYKKSSRPCGYQGRRITGFLHWGMEDE
jgi:DNA invertase Pin-like site-specific DNA recombinase